MDNSVFLPIFEGTYNRLLLCEAQGFAERKEQELTLSEQVYRIKLIHLCYEIAKVYGKGCFE